MTDDQIIKLRDALNLIAQITVFHDTDSDNRDKAYSLVKQVIDESKNPFTAHWKEQA